MTLTCVKLTKEKKKLSGRTLKTYYTDRLVSQSLHSSPTWWVPKNIACLSHLPTRWHTRAQSECVPVPPPRESSNPFRYNAILSGLALDTQSELKPILVKDWCPLTTRTLPPSQAPLGERSRPHLVFYPESSRE
jgi:hypothetical protein